MADVQRRRDSIRDLTKGVVCFGREAVACGQPVALELGGVELRNRGAERGEKGAGGGVFGARRSELFEYCAAQGTGPHVSGPWFHRGDPAAIVLIVDAHCEQRERRDARLAHTSIGVVGDRQLSPALFAQWLLREDRLELLHGGGRVTPRTQAHGELASKVGIRGPFF